MGCLTFPDDFVVVPARRAVVYAQFGHIVELLVGIRTKLYPRLFVFAAYEKIASVAGLVVVIHQAFAGLDARIPTCY